MNKLPSLVVNCVIHLESGLFPFLCSVLLSEHIQTKHLYKEFIKQGLKVKNFIKMFVMKYGVNILNLSVEWITKEQI